MSTTNLIFILLNLFFSNPLSIKQPINVEQHNISTPKTGSQDLVVTHYDCFPKHITMQYCKLNKIGECKIKPANFKIFPAQVQFFFYKFEHYKYALTPYMLNLATRKVFVTKSHSKEVFSLITIIGMLMIWNDLSFPQKLKLVENLHASVS